MSKCKKKKIKKNNIQEHNKKKSNTFSNYFLKFTNIQNVQVSVTKLDGVGPVDNRPSTDKLHHFKKKIYIYIN